ncbi:MAG: radical SAM protein [Elusimicrobia bacterium]|nr:radical SAM protein [Elusimicrobiota bacterium]
MKIALINPPFPLSYGLIRFGNYCGFPLGLGYIAAYARKAGHTVKIFDPEPYRMPMELMWAKVEEFRPDIVGITSVTSNFMLARQAAIEAKRRLGCLVVMGGPHVNALPRSTLQSVPALDAVILGEGEIPMLALANEFDARGKVDFNKIPGAAFIEGWEYREIPRPEMISELDRLPYPARDLIDIGLYYRHRFSRRGRKSVTLISSRGCPSQCTFCANLCMGRKFRAHSPEYVAGEMAYLVEKYGIRHFHIYDDCFTADPVRVFRICDLIIQKHLNITWDSAGRVNTLRDKALLLKMKQAGCVCILLGIEAGSQRILDLMKKGATLAMAEECCSMLRKQGIAYNNSFIIGNEGETEETVMATIAFAKKLKSPTVAFGILTPYPGTPLFDKYYGDYDTPEMDWAHWGSQGSDRPYEPRQTALSKKEIMRLRDRAYQQYYLSFFRFMRAVKGVFRNL